MTTACSISGRSAGGVVSGFNHRPALRVLQCSHVLDDRFIDVLRALQGFRPVQAPHRKIGPQPHCALMGRERRRRIPGGIQGAAQMMPGQRILGVRFDRPLQQLEARRGCPRRMAAKASTFSAST